MKISRIKKIALASVSFDPDILPIFFTCGSVMFTPLAILNIVLEKLFNQTFDSLVSALQYLSKIQKHLLFILDEAQYLYVLPNSKNYTTSLQTIEQIRQICSWPGSCCILCGSSTTLVDLVLRRKSTALGAMLVEKYDGYASLNHQKFMPVILPLLQKDEIGPYLKVLITLLHQLILLVHLPQSQSQSN